MKEGKYQGANFAIEHSELLKDHDYSVAPFFGFNKEARMLQLPLLPKQVSKAELVEALKVTPGLVECHMSESLKSANYA